MQQQPAQPAPGQQAPVAQPIPIPAAGSGTLGGALGGASGGNPGGDGGNTPIPPIPVPRVDADIPARASAVNGTGPLAARPL
ncbi:hypothetical protein A9G00_09805 [Achromobacter xylosoxidans]|nr:hypothetical protein A9G00_09805 [Achromobacter xylosoxidans]